MEPPDLGSPDTHALLEEVLAAGSIRSVYQPLVDLNTRSVVGYEALARGPEGSPLERPDLLFAAARKAGRLADLDWACRVAAVTGALQAGLAPPFTLFANVEPSTLGAAVPAETLELIDEAQRRMRIMVEVTERELTHGPADLLAAVTGVRRRGWGVALDDVGADPASLALMPFLNPDVIKLDLRLVRDQPDTDIAGVVTAVNAQAERTDALVLAEGIETEEHLETALALGATLGQGWLLGRPGPLPSPLPELATGIPLLETDDGDDLTPFEAVREHAQLRRGRGSLLAALSQHLENEAFNLPVPPVVLASFQDATRFTANLRTRYARLARQAAFVGVLGVGMEREPATGVRGAELADDDPLLGVWSVHVMGPNFSGALVARDLGDSGPLHQRRFEFTVTFDRALVSRAARSLMRRIGPLS